MAQRSKIDSNATNLAFAAEAVLGSLPGENGQAGTPVWNRLQPNSYSDFGGELITVAPNPINADRQREFGNAADLNANGGFNHNVTAFNMVDLLQGFMFAATRQKGTETVTAVDVDTSNPDEYEVASTTGFTVGGLVKGFNFTNSANNALNVITAIVADTSVEVADGQLVDETPPATAFIKQVGVQGAAGDIDVTTTGDFATYTSTSLDFTTLGLVPGQWIYVGGDAAGTSFSNSENNGLKRIRSIAANALVVDKSASAMVTESSTSETIQMFFGDVLKNELDGTIARTTYNLERTLSYPDDSSPSDVQSEVLVGATPSQFVLNVPTANLVNADLSFVCTDNVQRLAATGPKQSSVLDPLSANVFNTSSDVPRINMSVVSATAETVTPLFTYMTELTLTINNNLTVNKAVGVLGGFEVTAGTFQVSAAITAYFGNVTAVQAVRNNSQVTLDMALVKDNAGIVFDVPLIALGDGRLNVEQDQPITLPLTADAARGRDILTNYDHTLMWTFFYYLPTVAG